jgi:5'-deoxynucleotidase YfbR-like HD superfamily hydrolase
MTDESDRNLYNYLSYVIGRLSSITRYSTRRYIVRQTVMEHIGAVAFISMVLSEYLNNHGIKNDTGKVIELALIHDVPEVISGDLPHDSKYDYGEVSRGLRKQLEGLEKITMEYALAKLKDKKTEVVMYSLFKEYNERTTIESKIVKLADFYDVMLYTRQEVSMGNTLLTKEYKSTKRELSTLMKSLRSSARKS